MEKYKLEVLISQGLTQREIANKLKFGQSTIKHWLKKYNLVTSRSKKCLPICKVGYKICKSCNKELPIKEFYKIKTGCLHRSNCKICENKSMIHKQRTTRIKMIRFKGSKCNKCKLELTDENQSVFEFHHIDPTLKDKNYKSIKGWSWKKIEKELEKCEILCANCHRIEHARINKEI